VRQRDQRRVGTASVAGPGSENLLACHQCVLSNVAPFEREHVEHDESRVAPPEHEIVESRSPLSVEANGMVDDESTVGLAEAQYMVVSCSAFVHYLISKAHEAGLLK